MTQAAPPGKAQDLRGPTNPHPPQAADRETAAQAGWQAIESRAAAKLDEAEARGLLALVSGFEKEHSGTAFALTSSPAQSALKERLGEIALAMEK